MKASRFISRFSITTAFGVLTMCALVAHGTASVPGTPSAGTNAASGSKTNTVSGTNAVAGSNAAPAELVVPLSVFDVSIKPTKDPFFPNSLRSATPVIASNTTPTFSIASFILKGIDGETNNRMAIINNRTLTVGEESEILTTAGKVKIKCVKIKDKSVVITTEAVPEPMEIFMRKVDVEIHDGKLLISGTKP